jgi:hypothetical protein
MIRIYPSPRAIKEMFQEDALEHDDTWMPVGTIGHARPLMFDTTHGSRVCIPQAKGSGTMTAGFQSA